MYFNQGGEIDYVEEILNVHSVFFSKSVHIANTYIVKEVKWQTLYLEEERV